MMPRDQSSDDIRRGALCTMRLHDPLKRMDAAGEPTSHFVQETFAFAVLISLLSVCGALPTQAQHATQAAITFIEEEKEEARQQLRRLLFQYELDPWIFTQRVKIDVGVDPHSHPILTLNTDFLDSDQLQLSVFLHEQAHWFVSQSVPHRAPEDGEDVAVIQELRQMYPTPPVPDYNAYLHLIVAWVELDAMAELVGEEKARQLLSEKVQRLVAEPLSKVDTRYRWYNMQVLEDTEAIGKVLQKHGLIITPEKGLVVGAGEQ